MENSRMAKRALINKLLRATPVGIFIFPHDAYYIYSFYKMLLKIQSV
jgi:hypothetical protein